MDGPSCPAPAPHRHRRNTGVRFVSRKTCSCADVGRSVHLSGMGLGLCQMMSRRSHQPSAWRASASRAGIISRSLLGSEALGALEAACWHRRWCSCLPLPGRCRRTTSVTEIHPACAIRAEHAAHLAEHADHRGEVFVGRGLQPDLPVDARGAALAAVVGVALRPCAVHDVQFLPSVPLLPSICRVSFLANVCAHAASPPSHSAVP